MIDAQLLHLYTQLATEANNVPNSTTTPHCVYCWYEQHPDTPFPADESSTYCDRHGKIARQTRRHWRKGVPA
jgi:hypothetical protein